jgi:hypothetical protein
VRGWHREENHQDGSERERSAGYIAGIGNLDVQGDGHFKKTEPLIENINREYLENFDDLADAAAELISYNEIEGELDEMWSFVQNKGNQRWNRG